MHGPENVPRFLLGPLASLPRWFRRGGQEGFSLGIEPLQSTGFPHPDRSGRFRPREFDNFGKEQQTHGRAKTARQLALLDVR